MQLTPIIFTAHYPQGCSNFRDNEESRLVAFLCSLPRLQGLTFSVPSRDLLCNPRFTNPSGDDASLHLMANLRSCTVGFSAHQAFFRQQATLKIWRPCPCTSMEPALPLRPLPFSHCRIYLSFSVSPFQVQMVRIGFLTMDWR